MRPPAFLFALAVFIGCSRGNVVRVENNSNAVVSKVVVQGHGFTNQLGTIVPGSFCQVAVHPRGESGVTLSFQCGGKAFKSGSFGYVETYSDHRIVLFIKPDLSVDSH